MRVPQLCAGYSKAGRWHFILGPLGRRQGHIKDSISTAHSTGKSLIACMDQRRRAERGDICTRKHYTQEKGRKTPRKLKTKVNKLKWKVPWTSRVKETVPNDSGTQQTVANHDPHAHPHTTVPHSITYGSGRARAAVSVPNTSLYGRLWPTQIWIKSSTWSWITARSTKLFCVTLFIPWIEQRTTPKCCTCLNSKVLLLLPEEEGS